MPEAKDSCVKPARGPIVPQSVPQESKIAASVEVKEMLARVGQEAPDFEANAFVAGKGFLPIRLSAYKGKWTVLCFYPGDFTFV
jgi:AhpC/TSA family